ncbi:TetR/AcrR family transcriptional regulator [Kitasatospora sp. NPDC008050]|uniref:TetR/AcrR family transcriptional regulator n=1 Tax=Kitasatospora sp. NPDC008050 TaxID=3364021 RepID=UPI0036E1EB08
MQETEASTPSGTTGRSTNGRANQKLRTRAAIVSAAAELMRTGREVTMPGVARAALVSEATAYRYFPDLAGLLQEAMAGEWPAPEEALRAVADSTDPVQRVAAATEHLMRLVLACQGATRAMIAATITRPAAAAGRPALRIGLIDHALEPLAASLGATDPAALRQLKRDLAVVLSAEALFVLTDLLRLDPEAAVASAVHTATTLTRAAVTPVTPLATVTAVTAVTPGAESSPCSGPRHIDDTALRRITGHRTGESINSHR